MCLCEKSQTGRRVIESGEVRIAALLEQFQNMTERIKKKLEKRRGNKLDNNCGELRRPVQKITATLRGNTARQDKHMFGGNIKEAVTSRAKKHKTREQVKTILRFFQEADRKCGMRRKRSAQSDSADAPLIEHMRRNTQSVKL